MSRRVVWIESATAQLAQAYVPLWGTPEGRAITEAVATLEPRLESNAEHEGESRNGLVRVAFEPPVSLDFEIHDEDNLVIVIGFRYVPPRRHEG
jgi:hypothetical protein